MVGVLVHDAADVKITGCRIEGFEHGVYVLRTPEGQRNWINGNTIVARVKGITLWGATDTRIEGNTVTVGSYFGYGIGVFRGSHRNLVRENTVENLGGPAGEVAPIDFPGPYVSYTPRTASSSPSGIQVGSGAAAFGIVQLILDGELYQFPNLDDLAGVQDNVVEGNTVHVAGPTGIFLSAHNQRTIIRGNTVIADAARPTKGITGGAGTVGAMRIPSACARQTTRSCFVDADCGYALPAGAPPDACQPTPCMVVAGSCWYGHLLPQGDFSSHDVLVEDNVVTGAPAVGIEASAASMTIVGNRVENAASAGLALGGPALGASWIAGNVLLGNLVGLDLTTLAAEVGAVFTRNDVTGSALRPIRAPAGWSAHLELSDGSAGNYWGQSCPDAFRLLPDGPRSCTGDPSRACLADADCAAGVCATYEAEAPNDAIIDSHPYGQPVAAPAGDPAPAPCGD
jgi:hypothetical protein